MRKKRIKEKDIYFKYANEMFAICYRYLSNKETAEEILNNGFLKVFKNINKFTPQGEGSLKYWIRKIIINECLMQIRKTKKIDFIEIDYFHKEKIGNVDIEFDNTREIEEIILELPIGYRTIFNLYAIDGYNHKEIAEKLDIKESTSRSQLTMARKQLKEILIKKGYVYEYK